MAKLGALVVALSVAGCGAAAAGRAPAVASARAVDEAVELASRLPSGADRCAVSRPGLLAARRRPLALAGSVADPLAWLSDAPFLAHATAEQVTLDGGTATVSLFRTSASPEEVRRLLERRALLVLRWDDEGARSRGLYEPFVRARFDDPRTLRLERGDFRARRPGAERFCQARAEELPEALEVSARIGARYLFAHEELFPRRSERVLLAGGERLTVITRSVMASPDLARSRELDGGEEGFGGPLADLLEGAASRHREGPVLITRARILWEDVAMALEDQRRMTAALSEDALSTGPLPASRVDVFDLAVVRDQRRLYWEAIEQASGSARTELARGLRDLLERALVVHPAVAGIERDLIVLLARVLGDGPAAAARASAALARGEGDAEALRALRREAHAQSGPEPLAAVLVEDGLVPPPAARRVADGIVAARAQGARYEVAESAWLAAHHLRPRQEALRLRPTSAALLPLAGLIDAALILSETDADLAPLYVFVEGSVASWASPAPLPEGASLVRLDAASGVDRLIGMARTGGGGVAPLARRLRELLVPGAIGLTLFVVPVTDGAPVPSFSLRLEGELRDDGEVELRTASGGASRVRWERVARYLARPVDQTEDRVFPPPALVLEAESEADALSLMDLATGLACDREQARVTCLASAAEPYAPRRFLQAVARALLADERARLVAPR